MSNVKDVMSIIKANITKHIKNDAEAKAILEGTVNPTVETALGRIFHPFMVPAIVKMFT